MTARAAAPLALASLAVLGGCQSPAPVGAAPEAPDGLASGFHWRASPTPGLRWALLLPGASGLTIFDDHRHYFRAADDLNARGFDVLVIDYKRAYRASPDRPDLPTGAKIAWVVDRAVDWARASHLVRADEPAALIAWSLGAEGLWPILADPAHPPSLGLKAAALYYPSNQDLAPVAPTIPLLILQGEADDVTTLADLRRTLPDPLPPAIVLRTYHDARHGFDVATIRGARTVRLLPLIGPKATFAHDPQAARDARDALAAFLDANVHP